MKVLFGTGNKTRLDFLKGILKEFPFELVSLKDENIQFRVEETGKDPKENSLIKAREYHELSKIPTFSIDAGLYIDSFPEEQQPGVFVKRIVDGTEDVSDEEMLQFYIDKLIEFGGDSSAYWRISISFVLNEDKIYGTTFERKTYFTVDPCESRTLNEPLNAIQIDKSSGKYVAELCVDEKIVMQNDMVEHIRGFFKEVIDKEIRDIKIREAVIEDY